MTHALRSRSQRLEVPWVRPAVAAVGRAGATKCTRPSVRGSWHSELQHATVAAVAVAALQQQRTTSHPRGSSSRSRHYSAGLASRSVRPVRRIRWTALPAAAGECAACRWAVVWAPGSRVHAPPPGPITRRVQSQASVTPQLAGRVRQRSTRARPHRQRYRSPRWLQRRRQRWQQSWRRWWWWLRRTCCGRAGGTRGRGRRDQAGPGVGREATSSGGPQGADLRAHSSF